jgi:hypothetical protein
MLNIQEFNLLALRYKEEYAIGRGQLIMRRHHFPYLIGLFQLQEFYAEVWYDVRTNTICEVVALPEKELFEHYSDFIALESLY